jgi:hypothetical protein
MQARSVVKTHQALSFRRACIKTKSIPPQGISQTVHPEKQRKESCTCSGLVKKLEVVGQHSI